jgi:thioredoxin reductase (NADPH)
LAAESDDAFLQLNDAELAALRPLGVRRAVSAGEYLYREGDPAYDFYVVLAGEVEIVVNSDGKERVIARHSSGRFLGELNLLTGQRVFVSARIAEPGEVLAVPRDALRRLIATDASLSDKILAAFLARRALLMTGASSAIRVVGSRFSPDSGRVREFLVRNRIPHEWLDPDADRDVERLLQEFDIAPRDLPVVIVSGKVLRRPTPGVLADYLGLTVGAMPNGGFDLIVVGAGPAGLAAAVYGASEGLRTLVLEMVAVGGQAGSSSRIENYLGFPTGISGGDLTQRATVQAQKFGASLAAPARSHRCRRNRAISFSACPMGRRCRVGRSLSRPERGTGGSTPSASSSSSPAACTTPRPSWRPERVRVRLRWSLGAVTPPDRRRCFSPLLEALSQS